VSETIHAEMKKSTKLASKANAEKDKKRLEKMVPEWLHNYCSVFEKTEFEEIMMPPHRPWDHKIELVKGAQPWDHPRLIPLSNNEILTTSIGQY
jgi:hypothetical protein